MTRRRRGARLALGGLGPATGALAAGALAAGALAAGQPPGAAPHADARRLLAAGEAEAAVEGAFRALADSERFSPPDWSAEAPEGNIVLDEFTGAANAAYRRQRAAYRVTLGDALAAAGDAEGAGREYRRATALDPRPGTWRRLADLPGVSVAERVDFLLRAWARSGGADREALELLRESGAFRTEDGLAAALDHFRFRAPDAFRGRMPEGTAPWEGPFPALTLAVEGGAWSSERSFAEGRSLVLYFPAAGCLRCGEVVDELQTALRGQPTDLIAAVADADLAILLRIVQLTGAGLFQPEPQTASARSALRPRPIGHVVRRETVAFPSEPEPDETLWLAARAGLSIWRLPLPEGGSVRRRLEALLRFLDDSPVGGGGEMLIEVPAEAGALIETLRRLEAGPEPLTGIEDRLLAAVRATLRQSPDPAAAARPLLAAAADLGAGDAARLALLTGLVPRFGERLLEAARQRDGRVTRAVPGGRLRVAAGLAPGAGRLAIQRDYEADDGSPLALAAVLRSGHGGEIRALEIAPGRAAAVIAREDGFVFVREEPDGGRCVSWGPPEGPLRQDCAAGVHRGAVVRSRSQLAGTGAVATEGDAPRYFVRRDGGPEPPEVSALTEGLAAFTAGEWDRAEAAFARVARLIGPGSPLDGAAIRYNLARVEGARGNRDSALATLQSIGDATFIAVLEAAIRDLYRAGAGR